MKKNNIKPTRKGVSKKKTTTSKPNFLFKFLDDITFGKQNILSSSNEYQYDKYIITKFLSVKTSYLPICDILNEHGQRWTNYQFHDFCIEVIPKKKVFFKYGDIKGTLLIGKYKKQVSLISDFFKVSPQEAFDYYKICGDSLVDDINESRGIMN